MRRTFIRQALVKAEARRLASEALDEIQISGADFDDADRITAEERVAIFKEIRRLSERLHLDSMEWEKLA